MATFLNPETQLPVMSYSRLRFLVARFARHQQGYEWSKAMLIEDGWTFDDLMGTAQGSTAKLIAHKDWLEPDIGEEVDHWTGIYDQGSGFLSLPEFDNPMSAFMSYPGPTAVSDDEEENMHQKIIHFTFLLRFPESFFIMGLASRVTADFVQFLLAKQIEMLLCLDNRGRPRLV